MSKRAASAKAAWVAMLAAHRRPWPEWVELERRVRERDFVTHSIGPHHFLFSEGVASEPPLSRSISSRGAPLREIAPPFPGWVAALVGLGCQGAGDLASAGVLADLWPPDRLRAIATPADWEDAWHFGPLKRPLDGPVYIFQRNRSGTPLFSDGATVLGFEEKTFTLERVAELEAFSRFSLRCTLRGEDWADAYRRGDGESEGIRRLEYF